MKPEDNIQKRIEDLKSMEFDSLIGPYWKFSLGPKYDSKYPDYYNGGVLDSPIQDHKDMSFHFHEWFEKNTHELASYIYSLKINNDTLFAYHWHPFRTIEENATDGWVGAPHLHLGKWFKFVPKLHFPTPYYNGDSDTAIDLILQPKNLIHVVTRFIQEEVLLRIGD